MERNEMKKLFIENGLADFARDVLPLDDPRLTHFK
jgi:hypothetical protein